MGAALDHAVSFVP